MLISITDDFDLGKILDSGQCFRASMEDGWFRFITGRSVLLIRKVDEALFEVSCDKYTWKSVWMPYFDLGRNYAEIRRQFQYDQYMSDAVTAGRGIRILRQDPWETLISFIISQRKSIPAIRTSVERLCSQFGERLSMRGSTVTLFPTAMQLASASTGELQECGLGYRIPYIREAVERCIAKPELLTEWNSLSDQDLFAALTGIKGVGSKVANCVMLFAYGRLRCIPVDVWIKRVIDTEYAGQNPFDSYDACSGLMQQYVFYYARSKKNQTAALANHA